MAGLRSEVEWNYQRERAEASVRWIRGVKGITNSIEVKPRASPLEIRRKIEDALRRAAEIDAGRITVETAGGDVFLRGTARPRRGPSATVQWEVYPETPKQKALLGQTVRFGDLGFCSGSGAMLNVISEVFDTLGKLGSDPGWITFDEVVRAEVLVGTWFFKI